MVSDDKVGTNIVTSGGGEPEVYTYDAGDNAKGRLSKIADSSGELQYAYDQHGRITSLTRTIAGVSYITSYRYDTAGRFTGMTYPSGRSVDYVQDALSRIKTITTTFGGGTVPVLNDVSYHAFGPAHVITFGNGRTQTRAYDLDGRISSFSLANQSMAVTYDDANRITGIGDSANPSSGNTYGYDFMDRLTSVAAPGSNQTYTYDAVGNRKLKTNNAATTTYTYGATNNRLTHVGGQAIVMDANGSTTDKPGATFNYDARGRMVSANTSIGLVSYVINSLGQRVRKVTPTEATVFHYDLGGKLIGETTTAGGVSKTQEYIYLGDMPVAVLK